MPEIMGRDLAPPGGIATAAEARAATARAVPIGRTAVVVSVITGLARIVGTALGGVVGFRRVWIPVVPGPGMPIRTADVHPVVATRARPIASPAALARRKAAAAPRRVAARPDACLAKSTPAGLAPTAGL